MIDNMSINDKWQVRFRQKKMYDISVTQSIPTAIIKIIDMGSIINSSYIHNIMMRLLDSIIIIAIKLWYNCNQTTFRGLNIKDKILEPKMLYNFNTHVKVVFQILRFDKIHCCWIICWRRKNHSSINFLDSKMKQQIHFEEERIKGILQFIGEFISYG